MIKLQIKRGQLTNIPVLDTGEFALSVNTNELFIGTTSTESNLKLISELEYFSQQEINELYSPNQETLLVYTDNSNNVHIDANIIQNGNTYETYTEKVYTTNDLIITRNESIAAIPNNQISGLRVLNYDGTNDLLFGTDKNGYFKVGEESSLQILSTREDSPTNTGISFWNDHIKRFDTSSNLTFNSTNNELSIATKRALVSNDIKEIKVVDSLPETPDPNILYFVK